MPDRADSGQGRDALDAALDAYLEAGVNHYLAAKGLIAYTNPQNVHAARAAVRRLAEQGEVYEVCDKHFMEVHPFGRSVALLLKGTTFEPEPGTRVRVTRIEEKNG